MYQVVLIDFRKASTTKGHHLLYPIKTSDALSHHFYISDIELTSSNIGYVHVWNSCLVTSCNW